MSLSATISSMPMQLWQEGKTRSAKTNGPCDVSLSTRLSRMPEPDTSSAMQSTQNHISLTIKSEREAINQ